MAQDTVDYRSQTPFLQLLRQDLGLCRHTFHTGSSTALLLEAWVEFGLAVNVNARGTQKGDEGEAQLVCRC